MAPCQQEGPLDGAECCQAVLLPGTWNLMKFIIFTGSKQRGRNFWEPSCVIPDSGNPRLSEIKQKEKYA